MPLVDQFGRLEGFASAARANGYNDDEIDGVVRQKMKASIDAGFSAGDVAKHLGAPEAKAPTFFEGLKRAGQAGVEDLGRTLLQTYKSLDPAQATSALEAGTAPLIAPLVASPPGAASIALGEAARKGAEQLGASPNVQALIGTAANIATPGAIVPRAVRGAASRIAAPAQRTVTELLQNERAAPAAVAREVQPPPAAVIPEAPIVEPKPAAPAAPVMPSIEERIRQLELQNAELRGRQQAALEARQTPPPPPAPKPVEAPPVIAEAPKIEAQPAPVVERPPATERIAAAQEAAPAKLAEIKAKPPHTASEAMAEVNKTTQENLAELQRRRTVASQEKPMELEQPGIRAKEPSLLDDDIPDFAVPKETAKPRTVKDLLYRGGESFDPSKADEFGTSFTRNKKVAAAYQRDIPGGVLESYNINPDAKVMKFDEAVAGYAKANGLNKSDVLEYPNVSQEAVSEWAKKQGVDILDMTEHRTAVPTGAKSIDAKLRAGTKVKESEVRVLNPKAIIGETPSKGRSVKELLQSEEGSVRLGPLRIRDGKPVEAPTEKEVKEAVDQLTKPVSAKRLVAGGLGEESTKTLSKTMGKEGAEMGRLAKAVRNDSELEAGQALQPLRAVFKGLSEQQKASLVEVLDKGTKPMDATTKSAAIQVRAALDKVADRAQEVNLQIRLPNGDKIPFQPRGNYFPHMFGKELGEVVRTEKGRAMAKAQLKAQMQAGGKEVSDVQVEEALKAALKASKTRYGHLEMARQFDFGDYSKDPAAVLSRYFGDAYRRINIAEKYGPDLKEGEGLLTNIGMGKGDNAESFARSYFKKVTGTEEPGNAVVKQAVGAATNFQAASKLGQAALSNISQPVYTAVVTGAKNAAKGYYKGFTKEGRAFAEKTGAILDDTLSDFMKDAGARTDNSVAGKAADAVLKWTGFTASERMNRIVSANAGRYFANETLEKLLKNPENKGLRRALEKMNINVDDAIGRGELTEVEQLKAGQSIVNRTQFKTDVTEIPLFWSSDAGRLITQFKKFQFKSGQMVKDEILGEMTKGNLKPFIRAAALLPVAGVGVAKLRDSVRFGEQTERKRNVADYLATVGTFGAFTDAFASSSKQPVRGLEYLAGPTLGDAGRAWEAVAGLTAFARGTDEEGEWEGKWRPAAKLIARQIPVVGPSVRQLFNENKPKREDTKMLEELGLKRERSSNKKLMKELGLE